jgi:hypothetical protein
MATSPSLPPAQGSGVTMNQTDSQILELLRSPFQHAEDLARACGRDPAT